MQSVKKLVCVALSFAVMFALTGSAAFAADVALNCKYVMGNIVAMTYNADGIVKMAFKASGEKTPEILEGKPDVVSGDVSATAAQLYRKFTDRAASDVFVVKVSIDAGKLARVELPPFTIQTPEPPAAAEEEEAPEDLLVAAPTPYRGTPNGFVGATYSGARLTAIAKGWPLIVYVDCTPPVLANTVTCLDDGKFPWKVKGDTIKLIPNGNDLAYADPTDAPPTATNAYKGYVKVCGPNGCKLVPASQATGACTTCTGCQQCQQCQQSYSYPAQPCYSYGGCCGGCNSGNRCGGGFHPLRNIGIGFGFAPLHPFRHR